MDASLPRRVAAEFVGTALLLVAVVGSGVPAARLSLDAGLQMLENVLATVFALGVLILVFTPVSGAHFNPVVSAADWWCARRSGGRRTPVGELAAYVGAQVCGALAGTVLANVMFELPPIAWSATRRDGAFVWIGEALATAGLLLVVLSLVRCGLGAKAAVAIPAYIAAAAWFTPSTSFANPAVTVARALTDTMTGIAPGSVPGFVVAELIGAVIGIAAAVAFHPRRAG